jgi:hypothetical protein
MIHSLAPRITLAIALLAAALTFNADALQLALPPRQVVNGGG